MMGFEDEPPPSSRGLGVGAVIGRYVVTRKLGWGGMASVYEARHAELGSRVAIKVLHPRYAAHKAVLERFLQEARSASRLSHPHVVRVADVGTHEGVPYIVMDYLDGDDLATQLEREPRLDVMRLADILLPVCSAVASAHAAGILHRDLKPANIVLTHGHGGQIHPVLVDFGIAKTLEPRTVSMHTTPGDVLGTPYYMSPEQVRSAAAIDARSDQYALGVILYECATGLLPYRDGSSLFVLMASITRGDALRPSRIVPDLPAAFEAVIVRAMSVDRDDRYASVTALGRALFPFASPQAQATWVGELGPVAPSTPPSDHEARSRKAPITVTPADMRIIGALEACSDVELEMLAMLAPARSFEVGERIFDQGDPAESCFLLLSGEVDVVKVAGARSYVLSTLRAGAVVGQMALIDHEPRSASVVARTAAVAIEVGSDVFHRLLHAHTEIALRFREQIAVAGIRQLRRATRRMAELSGAQPSDRRASPRSRSSELVYVQAAAAEWGLSLDVDPEPR